jgi:hypothetical protein
MLGVTNTSQRSAVFPVVRPKLGAPAPDCACAERGSWARIGGVTAATRAVPKPFAKNSRLEVIIVSHLSTDCSVDMTTP